MNVIVPRLPSNAWIQTFTGRKFDLLEPSSEDIDIRDIGHALSMLCRFTGHTRTFYSVAQHAFYVSHQVPEEDALWGLLHDAAEAYIGDMSRPLKHHTHLNFPFTHIEANIMSVITRHFGLAKEQPASVTTADNLMLFAEKGQLLNNVDWDHTWGDENAAKILITPWMPDVAEKIFLKRYVDLTGNRLEGF